MDSVLDLHRLAVLHDLEILDTPPELAYNDIAALASDATGSPIAAVNFVDGDRHWTKAAVGVNPGHGSTMASDVSFCAATVRSGKDFICIPDALASPEWREHPLVSGPPGLRFYAGATIVVSDQPVGVVCIYGDQPRELTQEQSESLIGLAHQVAEQLEQRKRDCRLLEPSLTDPLTGAANPRLLLDRLESAIADRRAHGGHVGVVVCTVDDPGRERPELADQHLATIAERLLHAASGGATVARSAPQEFTVVIPGLSRTAELDANLIRIRASLQSHESAGDTGLALGAILVRDGETASSVLRRTRTAPETTCHTAERARRRAAHSAASRRRHD